MKTEELKNKIFDLLRIHSVSFNEFKDELIAVPEDAFNDLTEDVFSEVTDFAEKERIKAIEQTRDFYSEFLSDVTLIPANELNQKFKDDDKETME
jgi:hypothetical protein